MWQKTQHVVVDLVFFCLLSYAKLGPFFISHTQVAKICVLTSFLNTRGELKVLGLTGERFPLLDGNSGFLWHLLAVRVPAELRARRIEATQDFQGFLMWSCKLFLGMSHIHLWEFLGCLVSITSAVNEGRVNLGTQNLREAEAGWSELRFGGLLYKPYCSS